MRRFYILDGHNFLYRLFFAVPEFTTRDGTNVNAVFGMAKILLGLLRDDRPDYLAVVFDSRKNFRTDIYAEYKGTRDRMPDGLRGQEPLLRQMLEILGVRTVSIEGYEADDIIGTLATCHRADDLLISILSSDKDLYQFIDDGRVILFDPMKKKAFRRADAVEKFGVSPEFVVDYLAIVGDSSDNIPGIPGFGPKKAAELIGKYGSLENIYANLDDFSGRTLATLTENEERAFLSKRLATIDTAAPVDCSFEDFRTPAIERTESGDLRAFFAELEFRSLIPAHHATLSDFDGRGLGIREIASRDEADELLALVASSERIGFATWGQDIELAGVMLSFEAGDGDKTIRAVPAESRYAREIAEALLGCDRLIGYDLKTDLRRLEFFLRFVADAKNVPSASGQESLF